MELIPQKLSKDDARLDEVLKLLFTGHFVQAAVMCRSSLKRKKSSVLEYCLGQALVRTGEQAEGLPLIEKANFKAVKNAYNLYRLAHLANETQHYEHVISCYERCVLLDKKFWEAHFNLANTYKLTGNHNKALSSYKKVLNINPGYFEALMGIALTYEELGFYSEALDTYRDILISKPEDNEIICGVARCHNALGDTELALESWKHALTLNSKSIAAYNDLANFYINLGDFDSAREILDKAVTSGVDHQTVYLNSGRVFAFLNENDKAFAIYEEGVEKYPQIPELWNGLINVLVDERGFGQAEEILGSLFEAGIHNWYLKAALARIYFETAKISEAEEIIEGILEHQPENIALISSLLAFKVYNSQYTSDELFEIHKKYGEQIEASIKGRLELVSKSGDPDRIIKIGYVSPDFRDHATSRFIEPIIANHDREKFHVTLYAQSKVVDDTTLRLKGHADEWCYTGPYNDQQLARKIQEDEIDILVDLAGHTPGNRLGAFAYKPAPVQISWIGYPFTTGMKSIDYYLTDPSMTPSDKKKFFVEKVEYLRVAPDKTRPTKVPWLPKGTEINVELPYDRNGYITFGCFSRLEKVSDELISAWIELLEQIPNSRLFLKNRNFDNEEFRVTYLNHFIDKGIERERLDFQPSSSLQEYIEGFNLVDLCLDTYPYNASTVSNDSLKMCVPFITLRGDAMHSRIGAALLEQNWHRHLIATDIEGYIGCAVTMATNLHYLRTGRARLYVNSMINENKEGDMYVGPLEESFVRLLEKTD